MRPQHSNQESRSALLRPRAEEDDLEISQRPKKQMRKGTRSCLQCRQRKVGCSFQLVSAEACRQCLRRGISCTEQEYDGVHRHAKSDLEPDTSQVNDRVNQLESLMKDVLDRIPTTASRADAADSINFDLAKAAEMLTNIKACNLQTSDDIMPGISKQAPIMSLFDNSVLSRREHSTAPTSTQTARLKSLLAALRATLPSESLIERIVESSDGGWRFIWWTIFPFVEIAPDQVQTPLRELLSSDDPVIVAKAIIYIALNICHLPPDIDIAQLGIPGDRTEIMERYVQVVDKLVTSDDLLAASLDGIECIALQIKYHINLGRTRRAWLLSRRAIGLAQQCGLVHFMSPNRMSQSIDQRRVAKLWGYVLLADLHISLLLGLSHCTTNQMLASYREAVDTLPGFLDSERYNASLLPIIKRIVERNQEDGPPSISTALDIDRDMVDLVRSYPEEWWQLSTADEAGLSMEQHYSRRSIQIFHHQVRAVLHMPFMLQHSQDSCNIYSYNVTLESSREIIKTFQYLRSESGLSQILSRLFDFFTFTAAVTLLLSLVGCGQTHPRRQIAAEHAIQFDIDSRLVDSAVKWLKESAIGPTGRVSAQCARALEMLGMARYSSRHLAKNGSAVQINIPYFGRVRLGPGKGYRAPEQAQTPPLARVSPVVKERPPPVKQTHLAVHTSTCQTPLGLPTPKSDITDSPVADPAPKDLSLPISVLQTGPTQAPDDFDDDFLFDMGAMESFENFDGLGQAEDLGPGLDPGLDNPPNGLGVESSWLGDWPQWTVNLEQTLPWVNMPLE